MTTYVFVFDLASYSAEGAEVRNLYRCTVQDSHLMAATATAMAELVAAGHSTQSVESVSVIRRGD